MCWGTGTKEAFFRTQNSKGRKSYSPKSLQKKKDLIQGRKAGNINMGIKYGDFHKERRQLIIFHASSYLLLIFIS